MLDHFSWWPAVRAWLKDHAILATFMVFAVVWCSDVVVKVVRVIVRRIALRHFERQRPVTAPPPMAGWALNIPDPGFPVNVRLRNGSSVPAYNQWQMNMLLHAVVEGGYPRSIQLSDGSSMTVVNSQHELEVRAHDLLRTLGRLGDVVRVTVPNPAQIQAKAPAPSTSAPPEKTVQRKSALERIMEDERE